MRHSLGVVVDLARTLNELDPPDWGPAPADATGLVSACHAARQKSLGELTIEDLRVLIGQDIALGVVVPLALEHLRENALVEADFYPGDLLNAVLAADPAFWQAHANLAFEVEEILDSLEGAMRDLREPMLQFRAGRIADPT